MNPLKNLLDAPTYARARLKLGITGVGTFVVLSAIAIALDLPYKFFEGRGGALFTNASLIALWVAGTALLTLPLEFLGGYLLPKRFGRKRPDGPAEWFLAWLRGVLIMILVMSLSGALIVAVGRYGGRIGAFAALGILMVLFATLQSWSARLVGGMRKDDFQATSQFNGIEDELRTMGIVPPPIQLLRASDEGFTGGIAGPPTAESLILPSLWFERFDAETLAVIIARRTAIVDRSLRIFGLFGAMAWTGVAFALASLMPGAGVYSVAEILGTSLWFTLFSFVGLLILPTASRAGALAADAYAVELPGRTSEAIESVLPELDKLQDDEPSRPGGVEAIFHPIPSVSKRVAALHDPKPEMAPWHIARTAIFLSILGINPLSRLVHCNVGRPELWIFLPADG